MQLCAVCGQWTAFYLDKYGSGKHRARFLDFVEGYSKDHKDLEPLRTRSTRTAGAKADKGMAWISARKSCCPLMRLFHAPLSLMRP